MLDFITWTANPNIIDSFVTIRWYGLAFAIGFWIGYEIVYRIFRHEGVPEKWLGALLIYVVLGTIIGNRRIPVNFGPVADNVIDVRRGNQTAGLRPRIIKKGKRSLE